MIVMIEHSPSPAVGRLVTELQGIFGARLRAVAVYGEGIHLAGAERHDDRRTHTLVVVDALPPDDLRACAGLAAAWQGRGLATPLLLDGDRPATIARRVPDGVRPDPRGSHHGARRGSAGRARVSDTDVRRACESQARSHALHLRESYVECGAGPKALARIVAASAAPFRAVLASVARLHGERGPFDEGAIARLADRAGLEAGVVTQVLAASARSLNAADAEALFPSYLAAAERLVQHVDAWAPEPRDGRGRARGSRGCAAIAVVAIVVAPPRRRRLRRRPCRS